MVDVWYNKGLNPEQRLTWEEFYIEQLKDMEQDGEPDHADIVRRMRRKYIRGMYMYECVCVHALLHAGAFGLVRATFCRQTCRSSTSKGPVRSGTTPASS